MHSTDFYLAVSAVIPVLALRRTVVDRITVDEMPELEHVGEKASAERARLIPWMAGSLQLSVWICAIWAEVVCLHTLETGHVLFPGSIIVWVALALLVVPTHRSWIVNRLAFWMINYGYRRMYHGVHNRSVDE